MKKIAPAARQAFVECLVYMGAILFVALAFSLLLCI